MLLQKFSNQTEISQVGNVIFEWDSYFLKVIFPFEFESCESYLGFAGEYFSIGFLMNNTFFLENM